MSLKFREELKFLEEWLINLKIDNNCTKFVDLVGISSEKHMRMINHWGMIEELGGELIALKGKNENEDAKRDQEVEESELKVQRELNTSQRKCLCCPHKIQAQNHRIILQQYNSQIHPTKPRAHSHQCILENTKC